jgi:hypothetical protein
MSRVATCSGLAATKASGIVLEGYLAEVSEPFHADRVNADFVSPLLRRQRVPADISLKPQQTDARMSHRASRTTSVGGGRHIEPSGHDTLRPDDEGIERPEHIVRPSVEITPEASLHAVDTVWHAAAGISRAYQGKS